MLFIFFFFFQAEDGIRDLIVTGVQTCALPISQGKRAEVSAAQRTDIWRRWKAGQSLHEIGRAYSHTPSSIHLLLSHRGQGYVYLGRSGLSRPSSGSETYCALENS